MTNPFSEESLDLLGRLLAGAGDRFGIVIVGGSALVLRGDISRITVDVDHVRANRR